MINIVDYAGGDDYGAQTIPLGAKAVTFEAATTKPEIGQLVAGGQDVTVRNVIVEDRGTASTVCSGTHRSIIYVCDTGQTYDGVIVDGLNNTGSVGVCPREGIGDGGQVINGLSFSGEVRNIRDAKGVGLGGQAITFRGNSFHDITVHNFCDADVHNECMYLSEVPGFTLANNTFIRCPTMAVFFTNWHVSDYGDVTIEGNVFGHTLDASQAWHSSASLVVGAGAGRLDNWQVRYNTFENAPDVANLSGDGDSEWKGNLGGGNGCIAAFTYSYNVGETCGGTGEVPVSPAVNTASFPNQAPFYADAPDDDFHLVSGADAIGAGDPLDHPGFDLDGVSRATPGCRRLPVHGKLGQELLRDRRAASAAA